MHLLGFHEQARHLRMLLQATGLAQEPGLVLEQAQVGALQLCTRQFSV